MGAAMAVPVFGRGLPAAETKNTLEGVSGCWQKRKKRGFSSFVVISRKSIN
jgi:hypothetical protein